MTNRPELTAKMVATGPAVLASPPALYLRLRQLLNHPKYNSCFRGVGVLFAFLVGVGFALFPVWAWFHQAGGGT